MRALDPGNRYGAGVLVGAACMIGLGLLNLAGPGPLLQWQPIGFKPAWSTGFGLASGVILLTAGSMIGFARSRAAGAKVAAIWLAASMLGLQLIDIASGHRPPVVAALGVAESIAMALGIASLGWRCAAGTGAQAAFAICLMIFGLSHFAYLDFTAAMVPSWLPARHALAAATGAIHALAGLLLLIGYRRVAALLIETLMMLSFVLLVHVPRTIADPSRAELVLLAIALSLTASTMLFRLAVDRCRHLERARKTSYVQNS